VDRFRVPLGVLLWITIPGWIRGMEAETEPSHSPEEPVEIAEPRPIVEDSSPPSDSSAVPHPTVPTGLRDPLQDTIIAVVAKLAEMGMIQIPGGGQATGGKPSLPPELHPAAAPTVVTGEVAGAWSPPPRPELIGPRSAVRRAFYDLLSRS